MSAVRLSEEECVKERIRTIVSSQARLALPLSEIEDSMDLYQAGMTSYASVQLMMALEDAFGIEFPDKMLSREVFANVNAMAHAVEEVLQAGE
jgi:acyl carrier protein